MDSSAFVKLVLNEPESEAVQAAASRYDLVSSRLLLVESRRAVARLPGQRLSPALELALEEISLLDIDEQVTSMAGRLQPAALRSLDAIHLATAIVAPPVDVFFSHDLRLAEAARAAGFSVLDFR